MPYDNLAAKVKTSPNPWREILFTLLPNQARPLVSTDVYNLSAAAQWSFLRVWKDIFRSENLKVGQTIVLSLNPSAAWILTIVTALWENLSVIICAEEDLPLLDEDAYVFSISGNLKRSHWKVDEELNLIKLRPTNLHSKVSYSNRLLFFQKRKLIGVNDDSLLRLLDTVKKLKPDEAVLSTIDWSKPGGFFYGFFPSYFSKREIFLSPQEDHERILSLLSQFEFQYLFCQKETSVESLFTKQGEKTNKTNIISYSKQELDGFPSGLLDGDLSLSDEIDPIV